MTTTITLLLNGSVFAPQDLGKKDILIAGNKIIAITEPGMLNDVKNIPNNSIINCDGMIITPGFIDCHVHATGGGGENGPTSRTPEAKLSELIESGITSLIGVLGTDSVSRSLENLLVKIRSLQEYGLSAWMYTGAYRYPSPTITGSVMQDIILIDQVIGVGELAISDHRGSYITTPELIRLATDARVAGMLAKKSGTVYCHMGGGKQGLKPILDALDQSDLPITAFLPTHMARNDMLYDQGKEWIAKGGFIDLTANANEEKTFSIINNYKKDNSNLGNILISSDAYGSFPRFNPAGKLIEIGVGKPFTLLEVLKDFINNKWPLDQSLPFFTSNVADYFGFTNKGRIRENFDADILILDKQYSLQYVIANGRVLKTPETVQKGFFD